jgi:hypothetical protein
MRDLHDDDYTPPPEPENIMELDENERIILGRYRQCGRVSTEIAKLFNDLAASYSNENPDRPT